MSRQTKGKFGPVETGLTGLSPTAVTYQVPFILHSSKYSHIYHLVQSYCGIYKTFQSMRIAAMGLFYSVYINSKLTLLADMENKNRPK